MCIRDRYQRRVHGDKRKQQKKNNTHTMKLVLAIAVCVLAVALADPTPPRWPNTWQSTFTEITTYPLIGSHTNKGAFYYDWSNMVYRVDRDNGQFDRYCGSVYKFANTPCSHLVTGGKRFLIFPHERDCCFCCAKEHGCDLTKPDWLARADFKGIDGKKGEPQFEMWLIKGLQENWYYNSADSKRLPYIIDQQPNDKIIFDMQSYKESISDPTVFDLPEYCDPNKTCDFFSVCTTVRASAKQATR
eukprot:TRINITY_DN2231_c0_g1_i1.p2 TRINITY_DN2231_c0_g1~~TRINITY_DN2231_c0_g1_i1.p2  ORF type:complete len:261 (+),score=101.01 TRINITY_DN2231_c0_g1_i1:49-783(+)